MSSGNRTGSDWIGPPALQQGLPKFCLVTLMSEGRKLQPQAVGSASISGRAEACSLGTPVAEQRLPHLFSNHLSPTPPPLPRPGPLFFIHKHPEPLAVQEVVLRLVILSPCLAALLINPLFTADFVISAFWLAVTLDKLNTNAQR